MTLCSHTDIHGHCACTPQETLSQRPLLLQVGRDTCSLQEVGPTVPQAALGWSFTFARGTLTNLSKSGGEVRAMKLARGLDHLTHEQGLRELSWFGGKGS